MGRTIGSMDSDPWAERAHVFVDRHYGSLRGRVRSHVIDQHLGEHLPAPPAHVVDVGCGAGTQSIPLARRGYTLTMVDTSPEMLRRAQQAIDAEPTEVADRITVVQADGVDTSRRFGSEVFDAALCHGLVMYFEDPGPLLGAVCEATRPEGIVSIVAKNQATLASQYAYLGDWAAALEAFGVTHIVNRLGFQTRGDTPDGVFAQLEAHNVAPVAWYGVRHFSEPWVHDEDPHVDDEATLMVVEVEASRRDPYRGVSRLLHVIGRKLP